MTVKASAAPAVASRLSVSQRVGATANPANAAPQIVTVHSIARPGREIRATGPDSAALTSPPTPIAAVNRPSVRGLPPKRSALIAGNSATGRPKIVAFRSARKVTGRTWLRRMYRTPATTARGPGLGAVADGRIAGSLPTPYREPAKVAASTT